MAKSTLFILFCFLQLQVMAQVKHPQAIGSKTLYVPQQKKYTPVPKGFVPVFINHVGRHGARHLTKEINLSFAYRMLKKADSLHHLLPKGIQLLLKVENLQKEEMGHVASISAIGENELNGIASRTYQLYPAVFDNSKPLSVATTKKGRTKQSAEAYLKGLKSVDQSTRSIVFNYDDDDHLRFYDFSAAYRDFEKKGPWKVAFQRLSERLSLEKIATDFSSLFFEDNFLKTLTLADKIDFTTDIYGFYTILSAVDTERKQAGLSTNDLDFKSYFNNTQLASLNLLDNAEDFLTKGPGQDQNGIQVKIAAPLLADFIKKTDDYISRKPYAANLRFAHAETIAPFAAIMGIEGASQAVKKSYDFNKYWKADQIIPFSANIQWILYQNQSGRYVVKFLLNEKEVAINGLPAKLFPYYDWPAVRNFYLEKLKSLQLGLNADMHQYLLDVK